MNREKVFKELYQSGKTLREIGEQFNISKQRVFQIIYRPKYISKIRIKHSKEFFEILINERRRIIYRLIKLVSPEVIKKVLQNLVDYNQSLRPINTLNITQETGMKIGGRERYRELVRKRDDYKCQLCFYKWEKGQRRLDTHHIYDKNGENSKKCDKEFDKMITLCHRCHLRIDSYKIPHKSRKRIPIYAIKKYIKKM